MSQIGRLCCSEKTRETSRYEYPADAPSGAGTIKLLHSGWAGKYVGQAQLQYNAIGLLNEAAGQMVPTGIFFDDALSPFNSALLDRPPHPSARFCLTLPRNLQQSSHGHSPAHACRCQR